MGYQEKTHVVAIVRLAPGVATVSLPTYMQYRRWRGWREHTYLMYLPDR